MKKLVFTLLTFACIINYTTAQEVYSSTGRPLTKSQKNVKEEQLVEPSRFIYGGWGTFGMASGIISVGVTPIVGYRITDEFSAGIGLGYQYLRIKEYDGSYRGIPPVLVDPGTGETELRPLNSHVYSPSVWARYIIWDNIFAHVQYEQNILSQTYSTTDYSKFPEYPTIKETETLTVPTLLVGGGLRQPISSRSSIVIMLLYEVLQDKNSPYPNNFDIRFGINFGF